MGNSKKVISAFSLLLALLVGYFSYYPAKYYFYLWKLDNTVEGGEIVEINESIQSISHRIVPLLVKTYQDVHASTKKRQAAALGLIIADKDRAERLFSKYLTSKDKEVVARAIFNLSDLGSSKYFSQIIGFKGSANSEVRRAVADYLKNINNEESIKVLTHMMKEDTDKDVRTWAEYSLQQLKILPSH